MNQKIRRAGPVRALLAVVSALAAVCVLCQFSITAWGSEKITNSFQILQNGLQTGNSAQAAYKQPVTLQITTNLPSNSGLAFQIEVPSEGITAQLQDDAQDLPTKLRWTQALEVAGIQGKSIPGLRIRQNGGKPIFTGGAGKKFEVYLTKDSCSYIEKNGFAPASSSDRQASAAGIEAGGRIALTFQIMLNAFAGQSNVLSSRVYVGKESSAQESVTLIKTDGDIPSQPVVSQAVLIKGKVDREIVSNPNIAPNTAVFAKSSPKSLDANEKVYIQASMRLPDPSLMTGNYSNFSFKIWPSVGLTVKLSTLKIAGIPCKDLPQCEVGGTQVSGNLVGNGKSSSEISLTSSTISYIETHGLSPATAAREARKANKLSPGDDFAITFQAWANARLSQVFNRAQAAYSGPTGNLGLISSFSTLVINVNEGKTYKLDDTEKESRLEVVDSSGLVTSNTYFPENKWIKMQVLLTMPTPSTLRGFRHTLAITVEVPDGVTLDFQYGSEYSGRQPSIEIAGLNYRSLFWKDNMGPQIQNVPLNSEGNPEPDIKSFTLALPGDVLQDSVEPQGLSPATPTLPQGAYPKGIAPGEKFAITFLAELNNKAAADNPVTVKVGEMPEPQNSPYTAHWINRPYEVKLVLHPIPGAQLQALNSSGTVVSKLLASPVSSLLPPSSAVANSFRLQLSTTLLQGASSMEFFMSSSAGVTIDRQIQKGDAEIAGIPVSDLPDPPEAFSLPQSEAVEGEGAPQCLNIDGADLLYIKEHGASPATSTAAQGNPTGIAYGSPFALTVWGYLNEASAVTPNDVTAWIVSKLQNSSYATDKSTLNIMRLSPIKVETHLIKGGEQTRKMSGWGVATEGAWQTLQISVTMPTQEEISAYKQLVIQVEPEKGVTAMSWAPSTPSGLAWNSTNWNDIYLAGYNLNSWQNHGILYTIYPGYGSIWMTGGSGKYWNVALGVRELDWIQQYGQIAATTSSPPTWASGVKSGEQFSLKLPVYLNSDSTQSGNLVKVTAYWGSNPAYGSVSTFDIVKSANDLPLLLPVTGGWRAKPYAILSLALLGASLVSLLAYRKSKNG